MLRRFIFLSFVCSLLLFSGSAFSQGTTSRISGVVTDSTGAAIPGVSITLTDETRGTTLSTVTNDTGNFAFDLIQAGTYTVAAEKGGFNKIVSAGNTVYVNQPTSVNFMLSPGDISEVVNVENTAEIVQTSTSGNIGSTISEETIEAVPIVGLRGRNPLDVVDFQPGVTVGSNTGGGIHIHGSRDRSFNYTLDGIDINEASAGGSNFTPLRPNPDSIQEFQIVSSNFTAELGRSTGAQVTFVTKSGTNDYHGNLFEYYQTPGANANQFENNLLGIERPKFIQHIFGGSFGGPIPNPGFGVGTPIFEPMRDKAFFFVNLQMLRASETRLVQRTVYTPEVRAGSFRYVVGGRNNPAGTTDAAVDTSGSPTYSTCSATLTTNCIASYDIGAQSPDPALLAVINSMPAPNDYATGDGLNYAGYNFLAPQQERQWDFVTRIDYKFSDQHSFYGRYAQGNQKSIGDSVNGGGSAFPGTPVLVTTDRRPWNIAFNDRYSPTPTTTNEFIFGISEFSFDFIAPEPDPFYIFDFNIPTTPNTNVRGNSRTVRTIQLVDNFTYAYNTHLFKTGINFRFGRHTDDRSSVAGTVIEGTADFSTSANSDFSSFGLPTTGINSSDTANLRSTINDFLGRVGNYRQAFVSNNDGTAFSPAGTRWNFQHFYPELDVYFQDSWRLRRNLTLDLGLRYEVKLSPTSKGLPILRPDQMLTNDGTPTNTATWEQGQLFPNDYNNLSPSVGFAWDPNSDGKMAVRANFRIAYDRLNSQVNGAQLFQNAPGNNTQASDVSFGQGGGLLRSGLPSLVPTDTPNQLRQPDIAGTGLITVMDPRNVYPEIYNWSVGFQRELFEGNVLEVNYIGKRGEHLFGGYNANQVNINAQPAGYNSFLDEFNALRADSTYNSPLINALYTGDPTDNSGTTAFRSANSTNISRGSISRAGLWLSQRELNGQQRIVANGFSPFLFVNFPQFGTVRLLDTNDWSRYQALEVIFRRRLSQGIGFQASYTLSESKDTRSFDPTFSTVRTGSSQAASSSPWDINNRSLNYAWSDFDRRHVFNLTYVWELPFGKGRRWASDASRGVDWLIGGWQMAGLVNYSSGRPFTVYSGVYTVSNTLTTPADCTGCSRDMGSVVEENGTSYMFTTAQRAQFSTPAPGEFGNTGRNYFIGNPDFSWDASLSKKFHFTESVNFEIRIDAKNVLNTVNYGLPTTTLTSSTFGRIRTSIDSNSRRIQFAGKFNF